MCHGTENTPREDCWPGDPGQLGVGGSLQGLDPSGDFLEEAAPKETV